MESIKWSAWIVEIGDKIAALPVTKAAQLADYLDKTYGVKPFDLAVQPRPEPDVIVPRPAPEPTAFSVLLEGYEIPKKIGVIRTVREQLGLGLKEARDLVDRAPALLREDVPKEEADKLKSALEAVGARILVRPLSQAAQNRP